METLNSLNERMNTLEKVPNESSNTKSSDTVEVNNKENSNTYQKLILTRSKNNRY